MNQLKLKKPHGKSISKLRNHVRIYLWPHYAAIASALLVLNSSSLLALPSNIEIYDLVRSGRWSLIIGHFRSQSPANAAQRYALARANEEEKRLLRNPQPNQATAVISEYLKAAGISCEGDLTLCAETKTTSSRGMLTNLSLLRASALADKLGNTRLKAAILSNTDLSKDNPVSRRLFADWLLALYNLNRLNDAVSAINRNSNITGGSVWHAKGKIYAAMNQKSNAVEALVKAATETNASWLLKAIYADLLKIAPDYPNSSGLTDWQRRGVVQFYEQIPVAQLNLTPQTIVASTSADTIRQDGMYLIRKNQESSILQLSEKGYTYLSREVSILELWANALIKKNNKPVALSLLKKFSHSRFYHAGLWRVYLNLLKDGNQDQYFNELLEYLSVHHSDLSVQDSLITFLIGDHPEAIRWADQRYFETAANKLPKQTGSGRFVYWLWRYYLEKYPGRADALAENFYKYAPGSYYSVPFWQRSKGANYRSDWANIVNQDQYYRWISLYGSNDEALRFLSQKNLRSFYNQDAVRLTNELYSSKWQIDTDVLELFSLGEFSLGFAWFKEKYTHLPQIDYLKHLVVAGAQSRNRFVEVYYLRMVMRNQNIPEDPFVLPPRLLESLYPRPYRSTVQKYARQYGMHEDMIYGLMRQESMFREVAESRSGALGLMQIMPKTGAWLAEKMKIQQYDLTDPETSINLGTKFFSDLMRADQNDYRWATISYNGGPGNKRKWKRLYYRDDFNYFLEVLPVEESRNYVRKTYENYLHYHASRILYDPGIR